METTEIISKSADDSLKVNNDLKNLLIKLVSFSNPIFLSSEEFAELNEIVDKIEELFKNEKISENDLLNFFQEVKFEIDVPTNSPYSDKKIIELLKKAFDDNNIDQFYSEYYSIEMEIGIRHRPIEKLLIFIKDSNFNIFLKILSKINNVFLMIL